jgi:leukotriene-A4 hydrolase
MQDTPAIKMPYQAEVRVVNTGYVVRMSANSTGNTTTPDNKYLIFTFKQDIPIPSYLIAFSIGNLTEEYLGKRTFVLSEPTNIKNDTKELADIDTILDTLESYLNPPNPYEWGTYAIII